MTRGGRVLLAVSVAALATYLLLVVSASGAGAASRDFTAYWAVTRALLRGGWSALPHLYGAAFQRRAETGLASAGTLPAIPFVNPPIGVLPILPLAALPARAATLLWDGVGTIALVAASLWLSGTSGPRDPRTAVALFAAAGAPTLSALGEAQYDLLLPLAIALAVAAAQRHRWARLALGAAACTVKPELFLAWIAPAVRWWRRPVVLVAGLAVLAVAVLSAALLGGAGVARFVSLNTATLGHHFLPTHDSTILGELWNLAGGGTAAAAAAAALTMAGLAASWWAWGRWRPRDQAEWWLALSGAVCTSLLLAPHLFVHDLVLLVVPAGWVARARSERGLGPWPIVAWVALFDLAAVFDSNSATANLPVKAVPIALLIASAACWRALAGGRASRRVAAAPTPLGAGAGAG